jgi:hypothetical protein
MKLARLALLAVVLSLGASAAAQQSLLPEIKAERAKIAGVPSEEQLAEMLNAIAWRNRAAGWGLSRKEGGNRCVSPLVGSIACDILHHKPTNTLYDVFGAVGDVGGTRPQFDPLGPPASPDRVWVAPVDPGHAPPPPPPADCALCEKGKQELDALLIQTRDALQVSDREQLRLRDELTARGAQVRALEEELARVKAQPARCNVNGPGWVRSTFRITCTVVQ